MFFIIPPAEAGVISKATKGILVAQGVKLLVKQNSKRVVSAGVKDTTKPLVKGELKVGSYGKLKQSPERGLDYHHIPSAKQMEKYGVRKDEGIGMGMERDRHSLTRTFKGKNREILGSNEKPREALARDIRDSRRIYQDNNMYTKEVRESLQESIKQNKEKFPNLYKKD